MDALLNAMGCCVDRSGDKKKANLLTPIRRHSSLYTKTLRQKLEDIEGDRPSQDTLFQHMQRGGSVMIVTFGIHEQEPEMQMIVVGYLRALLATLVWNDEHEVQLVKSDKTKFSVFSASPAAMLYTALHLARLAESFPSWLATVAPELGLAASSPPPVKIGIESGRVLLLTGDFYGDPVNVASKLGEDNAEDGQLNFGAAFEEAARGCPDANILLSLLRTTQETCEISKEKLTYVSASLAAAIAKIPAPEDADDLPSLNELAKTPSGCAGPDSEPRDEKVAVFASNMSGFTSLTEKHGILHYLHLVLQARHIVLPLIVKYSGQVVKFDGDNIIATFSNCLNALICTSEAWDQIDEYNGRRSEDFQIRIGCSLCYGDVLRHGTEIMGEAFEAAFHLAEEVSGAQEVLITQRFKDRLLKDTKLPKEFKVSAERVAEHKLHGSLTHQNIEFT